MRSNGPDDSQLCAQAKLDAGYRIDGLTSDERQEIARLRKRVKQLEKEMRNPLKSNVPVRSEKYGTEAIFGFMKAYHSAGVPRAIALHLKGRIFYEACMRVSRSKSALHDSNARGKCLYPRWPCGVRPVRRGSIRVD